VCKLDVQNAPILGKFCTSCFRSDFPKHHIILPTRENTTAHTARACMFPQHVISRFGDVSWPPHSLDLSVCDFFVGIPQGKGVHEQTMNDPRAETIHSSRNRSSAGRLVGEHDAEFRGEAPNVCPARKTSSE
jgi:hypothetical protein